MKTSNKILIIAAALAAAVVITGIVGMRLYLDKVIEEGGGKFSQEGVTGSGNRVERKYEVEDFSNIQISGVWYAEIYRGDEYSVEIAGPEMYLNSLDIEVRGDSLVMERKMVVSRNVPGVQVKVVMPELESVSSYGGIKMVIAGFSGETLELSGKGGFSLEGRDGGYTSMELDFSGGTDIDLKDMPAENVDITSSGALDAVLALRGGTLKGKLSGAGALTYYGEVSEQKIKTEGAVELKRGDLSF